MKTVAAEHAFLMPTFHALSSRGFLCKRIKEETRRELTLEISGPRIDFNAHAMSVNVRLVSPLPVPVAGPFTVFPQDVQTSLRDLQVANADNTLPGKGAFWNLTVPAGSVLQPKPKSASREFAWRFSGGTPNPPGSLCAPTSWTWGARNLEWVSRTWGERV